MSSNSLAFFIGLFGSIHCIGMCGPLAFALPVGQSKWLLLWDKLSYQFGRIFSYAILGLIIGLLGRQMWLLGMQRGLSLISGAIIIFAATARWLKLSLLNQGKPTKVLTAFNHTVGYALKHHWGHFAIGILNGLLPCGFVYIALLGAVNTPSVQSAMLYMSSFGLGTTPLMLVAAVGTGFISLSLRRRINRVMPYFMICLGFWFILRGSALNIPYLSPVISNGSVCH
jgi:sulfite exporter TauE/SafE